MKVTTGQKETELDTADKVLAHAFPGLLPIPKCPKCGSTEISKGHVGPESYVGETNFKQCDACNFQWDHQ